MFQYAIEWNTLIEKKKAKVQIGNKSILVAAIDNFVYAIQDKCPHLGFPLSLGKFENGIIQCKEHALEIDVRNGQVLDTPKADFLKLSDLDRHVRTFPTKIENGKVFIDC